MKTVSRYALVMTLFIFVHMHSYLLKRSKENNATVYYSESDSSEEDPSFLEPDIPLEDIGKEALILKENMKYRENKKCIEMQMKYIPTTDEIIEELVR